ncbi:sugar nucleotide-binding protein [Actinoplanes sp. URMC 104]|uniref:sugar nucleotide-binding protein n=1 Tax=Actinoplanes sp. URMC 104 TaxID=3423409 RepID=UPI003F1C730E
MPGRMMVTGATGSLGRSVARRARAAGWDVVGTYFADPADTGDEQLDIRDRSAVHQTVRRVRPDVVVHAATGRDRNDWAATADGAAHVAVAAAAVRARLVHVSSDAVFSGRDVHYDEDAAPDPVNRYGSAKAAAETAVRAVDPGAAVVRTSIILGDGRGAHELLTHALARGRIRGALFTDEIRKPVHGADLADALLELAVNGYRGVLNVAGPDAVSRYDLGLLVARRDGLDPASIPAARSAEVQPGRPTDVRLTTRRAESLLRVRLRGAREFLAPAGLTGPGWDRRTSG